MPHRLRASPGFENFTSSPLVSVVGVGKIENISTTITLNQLKNLKIGKKYLNRPTIWCFTIEMLMIRN